MAKEEAARIEKEKILAEEARIRAEAEAAAKAKADAEKSAADQAASDLAAKEKSSSAETAGTSLIAASSEKRIDAVEQKLEKFSAELSNQGQMLAQQSSVLDLILKKLSHLPS